MPATAEIGTTRLPMAWPSACAAAAAPFGFASHFVPATTSGRAARPCPYATISARTVR
jgi:hypothetical protein